MESNQSKFEEKFELQYENLNRPNFSKGKILEQKIHEYAFIKETEPCKITEVAFSKTGKVGHPKLRLIGYGIFTGKKYENIFIQGRNDLILADVQIKDFEVVGINSNKTVLLLDENEEVFEIPLKETDDFFEEFYKKSEEGVDLLATVISYEDQKGIISFKEDTQN